MRIRKKQGLPLAAGLLLSAMLLLTVTLIPASRSMAQTDNAAASDNSVMVILVDLDRISVQLHLALDSYETGNSQSAFDHAFIPRTATFPTLKPLLTGGNSPYAVQLESLLTDIPLKIKSGLPAIEVSNDIQTVDSIAGNITAQLGEPAGDKSVQSHVLAYLIQDAAQSYQMSSSSGYSGVDFESAKGLALKAQSKYQALSGSLASTAAADDQIKRGLQGLVESINSKAPSDSVSSSVSALEQLIALNASAGAQASDRQRYFDGVSSGLSNVVGDVRSGNYDSALQSANTAYLDNFEYLEIPLESHNATLKQVLENEMRVELRDSIKAHDSPGSISGLVATITSQLQVARQLMQNDSAQNSAVQSGFADIETLKQGFGSYSGARKAIGQTDESLKGVVRNNIDQIRIKLDQMLAAYRAGQSADALQISRSAYLDSYENIEVPLRPIDPDFTLDMEIKFAELRNLIQAGSPYAGVEGKVAEIKKGLDESERLVSGPGILAPAIAFSSSFSIIFREGLESALIIGAILTYLEASRNIKFKKQVYLGIAIALGATGVTWFIAQYIIDIAGASKDMIEAIASISAVAVLFWVSFWILNKVETKRWIEFVKAKVWKATATGSMSVFVMLSFFTVYREGFETVLFYQAMISFSEHMESFVIVGLLSGLAVIVGLTFVVRKLGKRLPLRVLFGLTMGIGAYMSIAFIGNAVREFQDVGYISTTSLIGTVPRLDINTATMTGIHPTLETVAAQLVLLGVYLAGSAYVLLIQPRRKRLLETSRKSRADLSRAPDSAEPKSTGPGARRNSNELD